MKRLRAAVGVTKKYPLCSTGTDASFTAVEKTEEAVNYVAYLKERTVGTDTSGTIEHEDFRLILFFVVDFVKKVCLLFLSVKRYIFFCKKLKIKLMVTVG